MHLERHSIGKVGWLRAAVLGANDGIVSTASLVLGVAAAGTSPSGILLAGVAGLVAGAMSMATGEYVSVSSQADSEHAALSQEKRELAANYEEEVQELASLYRQRGLESALAYRVAEQLMAKDALDAHAREELGLTETNSAQPLQAAMFSAFSFSAGALLPVIIAWLAPATLVFPFVILSTLFFAGYSWLYLIDCGPCVTDEGNNQNHFLERNGHGFIHGGRFSRWSGHGLNDH